MLFRFTTSSFRAARPQPPALLQNANSNLLAKMPVVNKMPMSISSPNNQCPPPRQTANASSFAKMHHPRAPYPISVLSSRADLIQNCPTLGILRPLYLLGLDSHSALPISARNASTELYLARSATHRPSLSGSHLSLTPKLEVL
jgi:hypothetical protein